ncbi:uncharacterized protein TRAVEDRAFT_50883 [Trametes versicolor FP-101664 SS1]|uniref:uncharacterized protein n=1 Tax=Trametes versicolor (strain FP-101664) TaxID=717944 RepID=UPI0004623292|nr:uncharacterized protein TRAVEDRAFT_50883 [Trametes versicolor FP-101664 SS1]EIW54742.1 hypothetical protein TRAVEDRAFT_50883 [Trametes versicolor FP-101664 SS1]
MYTRTPNTGDKNLSPVSNAPSTPSQAPRSLYREGSDFPPTPRTPNTPWTPSSSGSPGSYTPYPSSQFGGSHNIVYGLMTPPGSPDKIARGQPDFHPMLDAGVKPYSFDVRTGPMLPAQVLNAPAINHAVNRMTIYVGGLYTVEVVGRNIPTIFELTSQLASASARKGSALGNRGGFAGLTLRSIEHGVAVCDLHLRNM